ncbi:hypothetical protein Hypma_004701 [Hypsizygus marmoreus]|uniref:Uncharacterized protein n=1 Tax=Hypsizygus marmoreus TaxID=39966 RepID=A0A369J6T9_HYPMA|nr:hypothetical protein Hypma_004701 [Hypsizygus marmoreus]
MAQKHQSCLPLPQISPSPHSPPRSSTGHREAAETSNSVTSSLFQDGGALDSQLSDSQYIRRLEEAPTPGSPPYGYFEAPSSPLIESQHKIVDRLGWNAVQGLQNLSEANFLKVSEALMEDDEVPGSTKGQSMSLHASSNTTVHKPSPATPSRHKKSGVINRPSVTSPLPSMKHRLRLELLQANRKDDIQYLLELVAQARSKELRLREELEMLQEYCTEIQNLALVHGLEIPKPRYSTIPMPF